MVSQAEKAAVIAKWLGWTLGDGYPDPYEDAEAFVRMLREVPRKEIDVEIACASSGVSANVRRCGAVVAETAGTDPIGALCDAVYEAAKAEKEASNG